MEKSSASFKIVVLGEGKCSNKNYLLNHSCDDLLISDIYLV